MDHNRLVKVMRDATEHARGEWEDLTRDEADVLFMLSIYILHIG